jgi:hypothetical protein
VGVVQGREAKRERNDDDEGRVGGSTAAMQEMRADKERDVHLVVVAYLFGWPRGHLAATTSHVAKGVPLLLLLLFFLL